MAINQQFKLEKRQSLESKEKLESVLEELKLSKEKINFLNDRLEGENELRMERDAAYREPRFMADLTTRVSEWKERCEAALLINKRL
jgi:hypothetical protein